MSQITPWSSQPPGSNKKTPTHVFFCEDCKILKNLYFEEHLRTAASAFSSPDVNAMANQQ